MARIELGGIPHKGKVSFLTRCKMKWRKLGWQWRRWQDPEIRKQTISRIEMRNPFNPKNRRR